MKFTYLIFLIIIVGGSSCFQKQKFVENKFNFISEVNFADSVSEFLDLSNALLSKLVISDTVWNENKFLIVNDFFKSDSFRVYNCKVLRNDSFENLIFYGIDDDLFLVKNIKNLAKCFYKSYFINGQILSCIKYKLEDQLNENDYVLFFRKLNNKYVKSI